jgi:hypothetical protein
VGLLNLVRNSLSVSARKRFHRRALRTLALNRLCGGRADGLSLKHLRNRLEIEWQARDIHPWDRGVAPAKAEQLFAEQCLNDVNAAVERLFQTFSEIDIIELKVLDPSSGAPILTGSVARTEALSAMRMPGVKLERR